MILLRKALRHHLALFNKPSAAQIEAGNYPKAKRKFQGLDISIENPRGSIRSGVDAGGKKWSTAMQHDYGYIRGTLGVDGDHFDCLIGTSSAAPTAYVVTTKAPPDFQKDDEQKALLGFGSEEEAREAFAAMYDNPGFFGSMRAMPMDEFKRQVRTTREEPRLLKGLVFFLPQGRDVTLPPSGTAKHGPK